MNQNKSRKGIYIGLLIIITLALVAGYSAYAWIFHPENTVKDIVSNLQTAKIISTNTQINIVSNTSDSYLTSLVMDLDKTNIDAIKSQVVFNVDSAKFPLRLEFRYLDNTLYGKINSYPKEYALFAKNIANKWYLIPINNLKVDTSNLYEKIMSSGIFTGMHFSGISWGSEGLVRNYIVDLNQELLNKNMIANSGQKILGSLSSYAGVASTYAEKFAEGAQFRPMIISVDMFSGALRKISFSLINEDSKKPRVDIISKYDDSKTEIAIDAPENAVSLSKLLSGLGNIKFSVGK